MTKTLIFYWTAAKKFQGRAFPIALALEHFKKPYEVRPESPFPENAISFACPVVTFESGESMSQLPAIMLRLGETTGNAGGTDAERAQVLQILLDWNDMFDECGKEGKWTAENQRKEKWFALVEKRLTLNKFLATSEPSVADFFAFWSCLLVTKKTGPIPSEFPKFAAWMETMRALPAAEKLLTNGVPIFP